MDNFEGGMYFKIRGDGYADGIVGRMEQLRGDLMSSIYRTLQSIAQRHQSYLEATYHIRPRLIGSGGRRVEPNTIVSEAFLEPPSIIPQRSDMEIAVRSKGLLRRS